MNPIPPTPPPSGSPTEGTALPTASGEFAQILDATEPGPPRRRSPAAASPALPPGAVPLLPPLPGLPNFPVARPGTLPPPVEGAPQSTPVRGPWGVELGLRITVLEASGAAAPDEGVPGELPDPEILRWISEAIGEPPVLPVPSAGLPPVGPGVATPVAAAPTRALSAPATAGVAPVTGPVDAVLTSSGTTTPGAAGPAPEPATPSAPTLPHPGVAETRPSGWSADDTSTRLADVSAAGPAEAAPPPGIRTSPGVRAPTPRERERARGSRGAGRPEPRPSPRGGETPSDAPSDPRPTDVVLDRESWIEAGFTGGAALGHFPTELPRPVAPADPLDLDLDDTADLAPPVLPGRLRMAIEDAEGAWELDLHRHAGVMDLVLRGGDDLRLVVRDAWRELREAVATPQAPPGEVRWERASPPSVEAAASGTTSGDAGGQGAGGQGAGDHASEFERWRSLVDTPVDRRKSGANEPPDGASTHILDRRL